MKYIFWISWIIDAGVAAWWVLSEMKLTHIKPNPYSFIFLLYIIVALLIYLLSSQAKTAMIMSLVPAIPLMVIGLIVIIASLTGAKWN